MNFLRKVIISPCAYANFYGEALQVTMEGAEDFFSREKRKIRINARVLVFVFSVCSYEKWI